MRKKKLMSWKGMAAFAMALSIVVTDGTSMSLVQAAQKGTEVTSESVARAAQTAVSKVIGLKGKAVSDGTMTDDTGKVKKEYVEINREEEEETRITLPGKCETYKDTATGLYKDPSGAYYSYGYDYSDGTCYLYGKVAVSISATENNAPQRDPATGLYSVNGKFYLYYGSKEEYIQDEEGYGDYKTLCYYFRVDNEVQPLGKIQVNIPQNPNPDASYWEQEEYAEDYVNTFVENTYGRKIASTDKEAKYYEVNGRNFQNISKNTDLRWNETQDRVVFAEVALYTYKNNEIAFDSKHHQISWKPVSRKDEDISINGKLCRVGYQLRTNGVPEVMEYAAGNDTFTKSTSAKTSGVFAKGKKNVYEVRAVYYTQTKTTDPVTGAEEYTYKIEKTGDWSAAYKYAYSDQKKTLAAVTGLKKKNQTAGKVDLTWNGVEEADGYYIQKLSSDEPLNTALEETWYKGDAYTYEVDDAQTWIDEVPLQNTYNYFRVRAYVYDADDEYVKEDNYYNTAYGAYSNVLPVQKTKAVTIAPVTGLTVENNIDGTFSMKWNASKENVRIYYSTDKAALKGKNYLYRLADPVAVTEKVTENYYYSCQDETCPNYGSSSCTNPEHKKLIETITKRFVEQDAVAEAIAITDEKVNYVPVDPNKDQITSSSFDLEPGKTYYFTAVAYDDSRDMENRADLTPYAIGGEKYGRYTDISAATKPVSAKINMGEMSKPQTKSGKTSITMTFNKSSNVTGYEIYRKDSKGTYKKIKTTTSARFVDEERKPNTVYSYKARAYNYNPETDKTYYSEYVFFSAETSTNNYISVKAAKADKKSVKLSWTQVKGAVRYEIYRTSTSSVDNNYSKLNYANGNSTSALANAKWVRIKTVKKPSTVTYTDKKLNAGEVYTYRVVAVYKSGDEEKQIEDTAQIALSLVAPRNLKAMLSGTTVKVTWDKDQYAKKYEVKYTKYNAQGKAYKKTPDKKSVKAASYTIKNLKPGESVSVSVRAFDGKKWSRWSSIDHSQSVLGLAPVKSVKAATTTVKDANGKASTAVKVTWKQLSGAKYYRVYRSMSPVCEYNKDTKSYYMPSDAVPIAKESNTDEIYDEVYYDDYKHQYNTVVGTKVIDAAKLQTGVQYYYYVVAYAENGNAESVGVAKNSGMLFMDKPSIKKVSASKGKVKVTANKVTGATKYVIYRSTSKDKGFVELAKTDKTSYTDKTAKKGKTYYYKIAAVGKNALKADFTTGMSSAVKVKAK